MLLNGGGSRTNVQWEPKRYAMAKKRPLNGGLTKLLSNSRQKKRESTYKICWRIIAWFGLNVHRVHWLRILDFLFSRLSHCLFVLLTH